MTMIDKQTDRRITLGWRGLKAVAGKVSAKAVAVMRGVEAGRKAVDWLAEWARRKEAQKRAKAALRAARGLVVAILAGVLLCVQGCGTIIWLDDNLPGIGVATPGPNAPNEKPAISD